MTASTVDSGVLMFARFAYPPNALGLCGPADSTSLLHRASTEQDENGLRHQARGFEGAWPYLQLIAAANGSSDPLDLRVVEAYWIGNDLLRRVPIAMLGNSLDERFRRRAGPQWQALAETLEVGARPHHNFHVFSVYPWVGLLSRGPTEEPLRVLDQCRIRWGQVLEVLPEQIVVRSRGLDWTGSSLALGADRTESVAWRRGGFGFIDSLRSGDWVAMHWGWASQVLSARQLRSLQRETNHSMAIANERVARSGPGAVLQ